jgi:hypothetical protein
VDLQRLDFAPGAAVGIIDVHADLSGDVTDLLEDYTHEANRAVVSAVLGYDGDDPETVEELRLIAGHPIRMHR